MLKRTRQLSLRFWWAFVLMIALLAGCDSGPKGPRGLRPGKGGITLGGVFRTNEVEYFRTLFPLNITEVTGHRIAAQVYEGLVGFSQKDLSIQPLLAEKWEVDSTATHFVFHLRKGVHYHDDPCFPGGKGREVTANDFKYCLTKLCTSDANNQGFWVFQGRVAGADAYFESTKKGQPLPEGVTGIKVLDDYTLEIDLVEPFAGFLNMMALPFTAVFPKEAVEKYGIDMRSKCVGTGPFYIKAIKDDQSVTLARNTSYWGTDSLGNQYPYLDGIRITFIKDKKAELLEFKKGNMDMMYRLPLELTDEIITHEDSLTEAYKQYVLQAKSSLSIQYFGFLNTDKLFSNKNLRTAFNYAIDRRKIVEYTMKGGGVPANYGVVPPGMKGYDTKVIRGYEYDPGKAREYMAKAGYPNGKGFPAITLQINSGGGTNQQVAEAIQKMLNDVLNITVNIASMPFPQHLENVETGKAPFFRSGWQADYPDPENFLTLFYGKHVPANPADRSYLNSTRYKSAEFDSVFAEALRTVDDDKRNLLYMKADQIMIDDAAIMPIYYYKDYRLLQANVRNFPQNAMEFRNMKDVYFAKP